MLQKQKETFHLENYLLNKEVLIIKNTYVASVDKLGIMLLVENYFNPQNNIFYALTKNIEIAKENIERIETLQKFCEFWANDNKLSPFSQICNRQVNGSQETMPVEQAKVLEEMILKHCSNSSKYTHIPKVKEIL